MSQYNALLAAVGLFYDALVQVRSSVFFACQRQNGAPAGEAVN